MKAFLMFFLCVALVNYKGAQGKHKSGEGDGDAVEKEDLKRQYPGPYLGTYNQAAAEAAALAAAQAAASAQGYRPTQPTPNTHSTYNPPALLCHSCVDCPDVSKNQNWCTAIPRYPTCVTYTERNSRGKTVVVRGCNTCDEVEWEHLKDHKRLLSCKECTSDFCNDANGVSRSLPDLTAALFFLVLTPIFTKYTLS